VLPADKVDVFHENLSALGNKSLVSWKSYHPKPGETFESIAKKHGMQVAQLREVNGIAPRSRQVPRLLVVPTKAEAALGATSAQRLPIMYAPPIPVATRRVFHTVKKGETLTSIANRYHVSVEDLKRWNSVSTAVAGKTLALEVRSAPAKGKPKPQAKAKPYKKKTST
jgi:LysM repeat protein